MNERPDSQEPEQRPMDSRLKKQIAIVFLLSVVFSSLLIYFTVVEKTEQYLEQERAAAEQELQDDNHINP